MAGLLGSAASGASVGTAQGADQGTGGGGASSLALGWWEQRKARAQTLLNYNGVIQVDTPVRFNYAEMTPAALGIGYGIVANQSGTVAALNLGGDSGLICAPVSAAALLAAIQAGAGATAGSLTSANSLIAAPPVEPWFVSMRVSIASLVVSGFVIPIGLRNPAAPGATYVKIIQIFGNPHFFLQLFNGGGGVTLDLGAICALGSALAPLGTEFNIDVWLDLLAGALFVAFQDTTVIAVAGLGGGLESLPTAPVQLFAESNGSAPAVGLQSFGGFAMLKGPIS